MERLTAFEFVAANEQLPTRIRLKRKGDDSIIYECVFVGWFGIGLYDEILFDKPENLVIEGQGVGRPYWNGEPVPWMPGFEPHRELRRIASIRAAVRRELNAASLGVM